MEYFRGPTGHGWQVYLGENPYWFGRGPSGYLLGPYASKSKCLNAVKHDADQVDLEEYHLDLEADRKMRAQADAELSDSESTVYALLLNSRTEGYCVNTADGPMEEIFEARTDAVAAVAAKKAENDIIKPPFG